MTKMNKLLSGMLVAFAVSAFSVPAAQAALVLDDVIGTANLLGSTPDACADGASGATADLNCMNYFSGQSFTSSQYWKDDSPLVSTLGSFFFIDLALQTDLPAEFMNPGYFSLKFGLPGGPNNEEVESTVYFRNLASLSELVWQVCDSGGTSTINDCISGQLKGLSHYSVTDPGNRTPEPATAALIGLGLLGMAAIRRRKQV